MLSRFAPRLFAVALCGALALSVLPGCDTTDPIPPADTTEVTGTYDFTLFRFNPDPQFVPDAVVLDTLNQERTSVELLDSGQFQFRYRVVGGLDNIINGTFTVTRDEVTLTFESGNEARLQRLLLDSTLQFDRADSETLTLSRTKRVDLEAYSEVYRNTGGLDLTDVRGLLEVNLNRRGR
ncbi:MAG: hypothetical protein ABJF88_07190 [Rhodothermales bacterium]